jgi:hypothetical protein
MKQSISHGPLSIPIRYWATLPRNSEQSRAHGNGSQGTWHCKCAVAVLDCSRMPDLTDRPTLAMSSSSQFNKVSKTGTTNPKPETSILSRKLNLKSLYYLILNHACASHTLLNDVCSSFGVRGIGSVGVACNPKICACSLNSSSCHWTDHTCMHSLSWTHHARMPLVNVSSISAPRASHGCLQLQVATPHTKITWWLSDSRHA